LEHSLHARVYKDGFTVHEITLTEGPFEWVSLSGKDHGRYWLLKSNHIEIELKPISRVFDGAVKASLRSGVTVDLRPNLPVERAVEIAEPAVVFLRGIGTSGTGFFITETGVIATNKHVAEGSTSLLVDLRQGSQLLARVVYTDPERDLALLKVDGQRFPALPLADVSEAKAGQAVIAIGNPAHGMRNSVSSGIISAIGPDPSVGSGTWIQTDAAINPGNSGGPLLNLHGEVVGINTSKFSTAVAADGQAIPLQGIGFALSSSDLIQVLSQFYPDAISSRGLDTRQNSGTGSVIVSTDVPAAEVYVDGNFVGQPPSTIVLSAGRHKVVVKAEGRKSWERDLDVLKDSQVALHPVLAAQP
jgi:S1-C subfamily serine protease